MQHQGTPRSGRAGRPRKHTRWGGDNWEVVPRQRADGGWSFLPRVYDAETRAKVNLATVRDDAEAAERAAKAWLGIHSSGPVITVAALQRQWLAWKQRQGHKRISMTRAEENTGPFVAAYSSEPVRAITRGIAKQWTEAHQAGHYTDLTAMFNWAVNELEDVLVVSPFQAVRRPQPAVKTDPDLARRALTEPELLALAQVAGRLDGLWHEVLVLWAGYGGQRLAELLDTHVDRLEGLTPNGNLRLRVETQWRDEEQRSRHTKGKRDGTAIIPGWVYEKARPLIQAAQERTGEAAGLLFATPKGERMTQHNYRVGYWYEVRGVWTAGLPDTHWLVRRLAKDPRRGLTSHELRHTSSTIIQARTRDLNASRAQLRHSKQSMTINYTHPEDELGLAAVDAAYTAQVLPLRRREAS